MSLHINTPRVSVVDPRGLPVRTVDYCRTVEGGPVDLRINRTLHDPAGNAVKHWDPRLWLSQAGDPLTPANLTQVFVLDASVIRSDSVDAGTQIELKGLATQTVLGWDSRQTLREIEYDNLLRPVTIFEEGTGEPRRCVERLTYGHPGSGDQSHNQYGQLIRHDHPAGSVLFGAFAISGLCTEDTRHFTLEPLTPHWPEQEADRARLWEPGAGATSRWRHGALGDVLEQTDARENRHTFALTVDGRLHERRLQLRGEPEQILISDIHYNAYGSIEQETAGNGVQTTRAYRPEDGRLMVRRDEDTHGGVLQHLSYGYDRIGNVLNIEDKALPIRYFANQRIDPVSRFVYDSLYQLIMASGWEAGSASQSPQSMGRVDPAAVSNYQQTYEFDPGGNLRRLTHVGAQNHGRKLQPASYSNRALPYDDAPPDDAQIEAAYDRRGNLLQLEPGRLLSWNLRNQLQSVSPVERASGLSDQEVYLYDGSSQRVRKIRSSLTNVRTLIADVRYLPGLQLRTDNGTGERLQVIIADNVQVQHWESPPPSGLNNRYRYQHVDHLGSVSLETADDGAVISREKFHPFGTSAWQDGEFSYKFVRYSSKERDATGLDYFGLRYYISWLLRWASADPAEYADGVNLFRMVHNNPLTFIDDEGAVTRKKLANGLWQPVIATGAAREIADAVQVDRGNPLRSVPATGKPGNIQKALEVGELGKIEISTQFLDPAPGRYSSDTVAQLTRKDGKGELIFSLDRIAYSGTSKGEFNALRIVDIGKGEMPDKHNAVSGFWAPQGGYVDIPLNPSGTQPDHVFTPGFSGCSLTVDQLNDNVLRVRHVEGGKENAQYNDLSEGHGMGQAAAMEYQDYGYAPDDQGRQENLTTGFAFMKYDRKQQHWNIHYQTIQGASGIEHYSPGSAGFFKKTNATVSVYPQTRVRKTMSRAVIPIFGRKTG
ncbi:MULTISPECIES: RHS repeat domain-containing protein [unclassified Pseudomonas]|uniref:RHS repeat domain-containing protein n=1 Tax=unclassified Pseudomonas TaxID=196821 RepID=UPI00200BDD4F|nr:MULTISPECIES: RHS repeat-associated core domain-containing protein [unclassified Pseudomonas]